MVVFLSPYFERESDPWSISTGWCGPYKKNRGCVTWRRKVYWAGQTNNAEHKKLTSVIENLVSVISVDILDIQNKSGKIYNTRQEIINAESILISNQKELLYQQV